MRKTMTARNAGTREVVQQIKRMLVDDLQLRVNVDKIPDDYSLLEGGLALDSVVIAELIAHMEDRFGLQFDDRVWEAELFENLSVLAAFVCSEREAAARSGAARGKGAPC